MAALPRLVVTIPVGQDHTLLIRPEAPPVVTVTSEGVQGPPGPAGTVPDPGDLTLIFENQLI